MFSVCKRIGLSSTLTDDYGWRLIGLDSLTNLRFLFEFIHLMYFNLYNFVLIIMISISFYYFDKIWNVIHKSLFVNNKEQFRKFYNI